MDHFYLASNTHLTLRKANIDSDGNLTDSLKKHIKYILVEEVQK